MAGLPNRPAGHPHQLQADDMDHGMVSEILQDAEPEMYKQLSLRDCLRSELKHNFDEFRIELTRACEKLRTDLLKDMRVTFVQPDTSLEEVRAPGHEPPWMQQRRPSPDLAAEQRVVGFLDQSRRPTTSTRVTTTESRVRGLTQVEDIDSSSSLRSTANGVSFRAVPVKMFEPKQSGGDRKNKSTISFTEVESRCSEDSCQTSDSETDDLPSAIKSNVSIDDPKRRRHRMNQKATDEGRVTFYHYVTSRMSDRLNKVIALANEEDATPVEPSASERWRGWLAHKLHKIAVYLDYPIAVAISLNGVFIGVQAQYQSVNETENLPMIFPVIEVVFFCIFFSEIVFRIAIFGKKFLSLPGLWWNLFDTLLVVMQMIEIVGMFATPEEEKGKAAPTANTNFSFLRMVRVLRLFRVLRLVRLLQFITELNVIISSIANSVRSLFWTMFLLLLMIYMVGITFTQIVFSYRMDRTDQEADEAEEQMDYWWGSLLRSTLSLYQAILGGVDWDTIVDPLTQKISVFLAPIFALYIAFALLAMMNVITGIFVESALKNAAADKDNDFVRATTELFADGTVDDAGVVKQEDFELKMECDELKAFVRQVGIEPRDAKLMFRLIDSDGTGSLYLHQLLSGMLRLRSAAKVLDLAVMMHEQHNRIRDLEFMLGEVERQLVDVREVVSKSTEALLNLNTSVAEIVGSSAAKITSSRVAKQLLC